MNKLLSKAAAVLCVLALAAAPAGAAEWISLSDWAYAEVSGFVSEGLIPECLSGVYDFTAPVTRGGFAELLCSVLENTVRLGSDVRRGQFSDCEAYPGVNALDASVFEGLVCDGSRFLPEQALTREEAALILYNTARRTGLPGFSDAPAPERLGELISDADAVSGYAAEAVGAVIGGGLMNGSGAFEPKAAMTIEQAVAVMYRLYKRIPKAVYPDSELTDGNGGTVQTYENGLTELYRDGKYIIAENGAELMSFEADAYTKLLSCDSGGRRLVFAVNFNDKTDVYDIDTGVVLCSIPYIVYRLDAENGYAYVYSSRFMPVYSGLYSFDGTELMEPRYSEAELHAIAENGFEPPVTETHSPDGTVCYIGADGSIHSVDTNGGNERIIEGTSGAEGLEYENGMIFYNYGDEQRLGCIAAGTAYDVSDKRAVLIADRAAVFYPQQPSPEAEERIFKHISDGRVYTGGFFVKQISAETAAEDGGFISGEPKRYILTSQHSDGSASDSAEYGYYLSRVRITETGPESEAVTDFPAAGICFDGARGRIYFLNADELYGAGDSPVYVYDGETVRVLSQAVRAESFGFLCDGGEVNTDKLGYVTRDDIGGGTYHVLDISDGSISGEKLTEGTAAEPGALSEGMADTLAEGVTAETDGNDVIISAGGVGKKIENARALCAAGDYVYLYGYEAPVYGTVTNTLPAAGLTLTAYNYKTGVLTELSRDFAELAAVTGDRLIYRTADGRYKTVSGTECESVLPNGGLFKNAEAAGIYCSGGTVFKADAAGNVTVLAEGAKDWIYIEG